MHTITKPEDQVNSGPLLDIGVGEGVIILELFVRKDDTLLVGWDSVLDRGLDIVNHVR